MEKQRKAAEEEKTKDEGVAVKKEKKTKKAKKNISNHVIPERKKYEMLCRGEGIKLVRNAKRYAKTPFLTQ